MLKKQDIDDLSAMEIKLKFNIPALPTKISEVHLPKGTVIRNGIVGETKSFGKSEGAIQNEILEVVKDEWIQNTSDLF